jgi:lipopolysaccharide/colanic/teichoic acid biosynthesis glycosyltransferase
MNDHEHSSINNDEEPSGPRLADEAPQHVDSDAAGGGDHVPWFPDPPLLYRVIKRSIDIVFSALMLVLLSPTLLVIALAVKLSSTGPVVFRQRRLGLRGKPFDIFKFRTMYLSYDQQRQKEFVGHLIADKYGPPGEQPVYKLTRDMRITRVGKFLRRTSLDETLQFWNVLLGDMSLVGPRPPIPYELAAYQPWQKLRLSGMPGITGLWQILGRSGTSFDEMVKLDIKYLQRPSIVLDLKILLRTPMAVLRGDKAY